MNKKNHTSSSRILSPYANDQADDFNITVTNKPKNDNNHSVVQLIRPEKFCDYPGQSDVIDHLKVYVKASLKRKQSLDHVLLHGPPGVGKTTLAKIIANELGVNFFCSSGAALEKPKDLVGVLTGLEPGSVFFIDEIHRLMIQSEELLYTAMEDFAVDLVIGDGNSARSMRISIAEFTLVGATTKASKLSAPLISRFGIQEKLNFYDQKSLEKILKRSAMVLSMDIDDESLSVLASCCRGTPRIGNRILKRVWDFAVVDNPNNKISCPWIWSALSRLGIDKFGLDQVDHQFLKTMSTRYKGGPVGLEALARSMAEDPSTLEEVYEPYLVYKGYLLRTQRGRILSDKGKNYLAKTKNRNDQ